MPTPPPVPPVPRIVQGDITALDVDAIVNAANEALAPGGGVSGAIHRAAGPGLARACARLGGCGTGDAKISDGYNLHAAHVIHTVGPVYGGGEEGEAEVLASCYLRSLEVAHEAGLRSIAFPCISTGIFGYPAEEAAGVALDAITGWLASGRMPQEVICCCYRESDRALYRKAMEARSRTIGG